MSRHGIINNQAPEIVMVQGIPVERDALRVAEAIHEYDENLRLQFVPESASIGEAPFRVVERCRDGVERVAMYAWKLDGELLQRIQAADCAARDLDDIITRKNREAKDRINRRYREAMEEATEIAHAVLRSDKSKYTVRDPLDGELKTFE